MSFPPRRVILSVLAGTIALAACGTPPDKEMHLAEGALEAARAAGAERYAPGEYQAAADALARSEEAVAARDYRLALNYALDAFERAQDAARQAGARHAAASAELEQEIAALEAARERATAVEADAKAARVRSEAIDTLREHLARVDSTLQEARAAVDEGPPDEVGARLRELWTALDAAATEVSADLPPARTPRRR